QWRSHNGCTRVAWVKNLKSCSCKSILGLLKRSACLPIFQQGVCHLLLLTRGARAAGLSGAMEILPLVPEQQSVAACLLLEKQIRRSIILIHSGNIKVRICDFFV